MSYYFGVDKNLQRTSQDFMNFSLFPNNCNLLPRPYS